MSLPSAKSDTSAPLLRSNSTRLLACFNSALLSRSLSTVSLLSSESHRWPAVYSQPEQLASQARLSSSSVSTSPLSAPHLSRLADIPSPHPRHLQTGASGGIGAATVSFPCSGSLVRRKTSGTGPSANRVVRSGLSSSLRL